MFQVANTSSGNGWVELVLIEARDLVAADLRGTSDPYVRVQYGNLKKRTKVGNTTLMSKIIIPLIQWICFVVPFSFILNNHFILTHFKNIINFHLLLIFSF